MQVLEEAGSRLESAISAYLNACLDLEHRDTKSFSAHIQSIAPSLDFRLESFHSLLTQRLAESRASISRTRNKLASKIHCLPPEILGRIFSFAIRDVGFLDALTMEEAIIEIYHALHRVVSVCSVWRNVALAHGALWSLLPSLCDRDTRHSYTDKMIRLCLDRAGSELHLAAQLDHMIPAVKEALSGHGARFRTINIQAAGLSAIREALTILIDNSFPGRATELSIYLDTNRRVDPPLPISGDLINNQDSTHRIALEQIIDSLRVLRLRNVKVHLSNLSFTNLVNLRLQELVLGPKAALHDFFRALASASQLRNLEIISVVTWAEADEIVENLADIGEEDEIEEARAPRGPELLVTLPSLRRLFLGDLHGNVIRAMLCSIAPGPYSLVISLSGKFENIVARRGFSYCGDNQLKLAVRLGGHQVDTIMLGPSFPILDTNVTDALSAMPVATTLYIDDLYLSGKKLAQMTRTGDADDERSTLPKFHTIHISRVLVDSLRNPKPFKKMIASYPLQELTVGGSISYESTQDTSIDSDDSDERVVKLMDWFDSRIPDFAVVERSQFNAWFETEVWRLW